MKNIQNLVTFLVVLSVIRPQVVYAQKPTSKEKVEYSIAWGLFKSAGYTKKKSTVIKKTTVAASKSAISTPKYQHKSILWGAIQWTEEK